MSSEDAKELFKKSGRIDRYQAIEHRRKPYVTIYNCDGLDDYFYGLWFRIQAILNILN
jgi:uridine kinase